jgi:hypothetical protein
MLKNWFSKPKNTDSDELYSSDEEQERIIKVDPLYENETVIVAKMTAAEFINVPCWAYNRPLDTKRVIELKNNIMSSGNIYGVFTLVSQEKQLYIIDGQHRHQALIKAIDKNPAHLDITVICVIYNVVEDADIVELFKKVNNTKPLDPKETPNAVIMTAIKELSKLYPNAIHFDKNKTVYPYVLAKDLQEQLKTINLNNISSLDLVKIIKRLNNKYSHLSIKSIPNVRSNITVGAVNKARQTGFYLGIDEKWSWIEELENQINYG